MKLAEQKNDLLQIRAFTEPIVLEGFTYYDSHSRAFCIVRFPAMMKYLFPQIKKRKIRYEIRCFPGSEELKKYLDTTTDVPLIINLFARENEYLINF